MDYKAYTIIATQALKWDYPHVKHDDYVLIEHVGNKAVIGDIGYQLRKAGYKPEFKWKGEFAVEVRVK
jgi:hypothetical protein